MRLKRRTTAICSFVAASFAMSLLGCGSASQKAEPKKEVTPGAQAPETAKPSEEKKAEIEKDAEIVASDRTKSENSDAKDELVSKDDTTRTLWYGTNRVPEDASDLSKGYTNKRARQTYYGSCKALIPKSHKFGSTGSGTLTRWLTWTDDRIKIESLSGLEEAEFWKGVRSALAAHAKPEERTVLVFIHGYNNSFEDAAIRAAQIGYDLGIPDKMTAFFSWPSKRATADYVADLNSVEASEKPITDFLVRFATDAGATKVHLIAHSMGNRGLLLALRRIQSEVVRKTPVKFGQIILAAPDLDVDVFRNAADVYHSLSERTTIYASASDRALESSEWLSGAPRVGATPPVTTNPPIETIVVENFNVWNLEIAHAYFAGSYKMLNDIRELVLDNRAPDKRQHTLHNARDDKDGHYWIITDN